MDLPTACTYTSCVAGSITDVEEDGFVRVEFYANEDELCRKLIHLHSENFRFAICDSDEDEEYRDWSDDSDEEASGGGYDYRAHEITIGRS